MIAIQATKFSGVNLQNEILAQPQRMWYLRAMRGRYYKSKNYFANNRLPLDEGCQASPEVRMHILHRISLSSPR